MRGLSSFGCLLAVLGAVGCGGSDSGSARPDGGDVDAAQVDAGPPPCVDVDDVTPVVVATAGDADEYALDLPATAASATKWAEKDNEALILEVTGTGGRFIGHLIVHQGATRFDYGMHVGALTAGEELSVKISPLSSANATKSACVGPGTLTSATAMGPAGDGLAHAPVFVWPTKKRFDDVPMVVGWSAALKNYTTVFTNENGGTTKICGGAGDPAGTKAILNGYGRTVDIETMYAYGGATPLWMRCPSGNATATTATRLEGAHPILYYGNGHNHLFENRGGYGESAYCGIENHNKSDGDITGWGIANNPNNDPAMDSLYAITLRPLPVDADALGYDEYPGRREALVDAYAPWLYRLTFSELTRENKIDNGYLVDLQRYLYIDVMAADVGGTGDDYCIPALQQPGGFVLSAKTDTKTFSAARMTGPGTFYNYFGATGNGIAWKRLAIQVDAGVTANAISTLVFDAVSNDNIYFLGVGDAFLVRPEGDNGATLEYVRKGTKPYYQYVDDDSTGCAAGTITGGPGNTTYTCAGTAYEFGP